MKRRTILKQLAAAIPAVMLTKHMQAGSFLTDSATGETILKGPFAPTWDSLQQYQTPGWFKHAKFGMWAHWGPQCQPERGDWYGRGMYQEGSNQYKFHLEKYGHPSVFGFKDVIHEWKAEKWDPEELVSLYKSAGAQYFMAMANHHDNFDMFNSRHQPWNAVKTGPKKDIIAGWAAAAKKHHLPFGVSIHAAHAWSWYETAQRADKTGAFAGIPYDGKMTKNDGKGKWWEGLDPQELYTQDHPLSENSSDNWMIIKQWDWANGVAKPSTAYMEKFFNRTIDLINKYHPELLYFDDSQLPFWPISDAGLRIAAHHYNKSIKDHGELRAVVFGKILDEHQGKAMVWDIERGHSNSIEPLPWQTDTCIGNWHYDRPLYVRKGYKSAKTVIHTLIDVVSKNGNLLLNIPVRGDGSIDELERKVVEEIGRWINANRESIFGTSPWKIFGEGPAQEAATALNAQGFNEGKGKPFTAQDIRFTVKENALYAIVLDKPENGEVIIKSLALNSVYFLSEIQRVDLLATKQSLKYERTSEGLIVYFPEQLPTESYANALKIV
jgi:alpha-L-fucosidase